MFEQNEQILVITTQPITCAICGHKAWFFLPTEERAYAERCSQCNCWLISTLINYELFEEQIEWLRSQWI